MNNLQRFVSRYLCGNLKVGSLTRSSIINFGVVILLEGEGRNLIVSSALESKNRLIQFEKTLLETLFGHQKVFGSS